MGCQCLSMCNHIKHVQYLKHKMSAPKREYIVGKTDEELDEFTCGICHEIFIRPMVTRCCRQTYCKPCIEEWLLIRKTCPNDRRSLYVNELTPAGRMVVNLINGLPVKCNNYIDGCSAVVAYSRLSSHLKTCPFYLCECGFRGGREGHCCEDYLLAKNNILQNEIEILNKRLNRYQEVFGRLPIDTTGNFCLVSTANYEQFLNRISFNETMSKSFTELMTPITYIDMNGDADCFISSDKFTSGPEGTTKRWSNLEVWLGTIITVITVENGKLIQTSSLHHAEVKVITELDGDQLKIVGSAFNVVFTRVYHRA